MIVLAKATDVPGARRSRRQRGSISANEIVQGAFDVSRGISLDKLSMPNLAEHLDVGVTSIYWYFRKKEDLLNAMTDVAVDNYIRALPDVSGQPWPEALRQHFTEMRLIFLKDQTLSDLIMIRTSSYSKEATRRVFEVVESILEILIDQGFTPDNAFRCHATASVYARGIIIHDRILRLSNAPTLEDGRQSRMIDWSSMPILAGLVEEYSLAGTGESDFQFGLDRLICGFQTLLAEQNSGPRPGEAGPAGPAVRA
jgi:AcrR family transcriptional regulator